MSSFISPCCRQMCQCDRNVQNTWTVSPLPRQLKVLRVAPQAKTRLGLGLDGRASCLIRPFSGSSWTGPSSSRDSEEGAPKGVVRWYPSRQATVFSLAAHLRSDSSSPLARYNLFSCHVDFEPMVSDAQRRGRRNIALSSLGVAVEALNLAKEISSITPAKVVFGTVSTVLTMIKVSFFLRCSCWLITG